MSGNKTGRLGRPIVHGAYSLQPPDRLLRGRAKRRLRGYLSQVRETLILDLGPKEEDLTAGQLVLVDRAIAKLTIVRMIENFISGAGVFDKPGMLRSVLTGPYVTFTRELRADLLALGIDRRKIDERVLTPDELAEIVDREAEDEHHKGD